MTLDAVLITGGSGYLGHGLARALLDSGSARVCILSRGEYRQHLMRQEFTDDQRLRFFIGDVRDQARLRRAMDGVRTVIHGAALKRLEVGEYDPGEIAKTNVVGTMNVMEAAEDAGVERVVLVSTDKAYAPLNAYGASKLMAEKLVLSGSALRGERLPMSAVCRYGNVAGSTGSVIPTWRKMLEQGLPVRITSPAATRFWMTREEAVALVLETARTMRGGELAIPDLPAFRLGDLAEAMGITHAQPTSMHPGEKLHESMDDSHCSATARRMSVAELREALRYV